MVDKSSHNFLQDIYKLVATCSSRIKSKLFPYIEASPSCWNFSMNTLTYIVYCIPEIFSHSLTLNSSNTSFVLNFPFFQLLKYWPLKITSSATLTFELWSESFLNNSNTNQMSMITRDCSVNHFLWSAYY